jgi:putative Mg2+ transporter-C (MgtC) family protein
MGHDDLVIIGRVTGALVIGALIGFERTFHGRPAGFRTHSLVCIASAILMIVTVYQNQWMTFVDHDAIRTDPTRMAQGIMTGIGFLGAGVIFKEGLTVRGLTTAASIWVTAAIGILVGIGFWFAAVVGAAAALIVLALFRYIEARLPSEFHDCQPVVATKRERPAIRIPHDNQKQRSQECRDAVLIPSRKT